MVPADAVDPDALRVRTWLDGELVQEATTAELLFDFGRLVADLSQLVTLEPDDVILTGTPSGASVAKPGDVVEVEVDTRDECRRNGGVPTSHAVDGAVDELTAALSIALGR